MGVQVFNTGKLGATDQARYLALVEQRKTVGLNDTQRDEIHALELKLTAVERGTSAAE